MYVILQNKIDKPTYTKKWLNGIIFMKTANNYHVPVLKIFNKNKYQQKLNAIFFNFINHEKNMWRKMDFSLKFYKILSFLIFIIL